MIPGPPAGDHHVVALALELAARRNDPGKLACRVVVFGFREQPLAPTHLASESGIARIGGRRGARSLKSFSAALLLDNLRTPVNDNRRSNVLRGQQHLGSWFNCGTGAKLRPRPAIRCLPQPTGNWETSRSRLRFLEGSAARDVSVFKSKKGSCDSTCGSSPGNAEDAFFSLKNRPPPPLGFAAPTTLIYLPVTPTASRLHAPPLATG